ncbi:unnamed protein product [Colias eurytheme]|nr:unnamed protein product [Colias eurytheme]
MAASGERRQRRGPAPIASFDHDVSDESSPETKQTFRLPEIREDPACSSSTVAEEAGPSGSALAPPEQRARSHSSPAVHAAVLTAPTAPRIDISRASSSSHHDSRDSSPELALFAGTGSGEEARAKLELGFREDGALDLRSSTEELAFLEGAPGNGNGEIRAPTTAPPSRRHSRKDSQGSETALLAVSGRTSRLSSVGSQCSAHSALSGFSHASRVSRLSVVSGVSRSPSPHKMLLETSFCGPKPIETDPEICAAAVEERLLEIAKLSTEASVLPAPPVDARDRREVRTEVTVESSSARSTSSTARIVSPVPPPTTPTPTPTPTPAPTIALTSTVSSGAIPKQTPDTQPPTVPVDEEKRLKETRNRARVEERKARSKERREHSQPEVYKTSNRSKDIIRIKLKPDNEYEDDDDESERTVISGEPARKPVTLELNDNCVQTLRANEISVSPLTARRPRDSRTPSPSGVPVSRKSSFCSLFKSRETIASPDSPSDALKRKKSLNEGRSRSKSRDRSVTPTSAAKIKGSVLSLFKTPRKSATSPSPSSRDGSPIVQAQRQFPQTPVDRQRTERLKYYEESKDGIIHIPLRTPPDELDTASDKIEPPSRDVPRPSSAPQVRCMPERPISAASAPLPKPTQRTVLPDGSIIIPLHSPTEKTPSISRSPEIETLPSTAVTQTPIVTPKEDKRSLEAKVSNVPENITKPTTNYLPDESPVGNAPAPNSARAKRKERIIFTTHVGSREQVFSTQFSITKTPSVTSEISESIPSFPDSEEMRPIARETEITTANVEIGMNGIKEMSQREEEPKIEKVSSIESAIEAERSTPGTPQDTGRDSSESEGGSEVLARGGSDVERRGLVVQESFEELPYVPTTLPQERSLGVPIVPVRERGGVRVAGVQRPRATHNAVSTLGRVAAPSAAPRDAPHERLRIQLPRRPRAASASAAPPPPERTRTRSGSEVSESRKAEWIDFSEVPERRKQPKRIQTLPARARSPALSYAPPEHCRCECHAHAPPDDELPLLDDAQQMTVSSSSLECGEGVQVNVHIAPFTADLDLHNHDDMGRPQ